METVSALESPMTRPRLYICAAIILSLILFGSESHGQTGKRPTNRAPSPGKKTNTTKHDHQSALQDLFEWVRKDDFESIYLNNYAWSNEVATIKTHPSFKQEKELSDHRKAAEALYYLSAEYNPLSGSPYSALIEYALQDPEVHFLERRNTDGFQVLYYKLVFRDPEGSPRLNDEEFVHERPVKVTLDSRGKLASFEAERGFDVLWDKIPQRIERVELALPDDFVRVKVGCAGKAKEGRFEVGGKASWLGKQYGDNKDLIGGVDGPSLKAGEPTTVKVTVEFADGTTDSVQFDVIVPQAREFFQAKAPGRAPSAYKLKSEKMSRYKPFYTEVAFRRVQSGSSE